MRAGGQFHLRLSAANREGLETFADRERCPLSRAADLLIAAGLRAETARAEEPARQNVTTELLLHNLVATEQVIRLLEPVVRHGAGAADAVLAEAGIAAERRLSRAALVMPAGVER